MPQAAGFFIGALGMAGSVAVPAAMSWGVAAGATFAASTLGGIAVKLLTSVALSALSIAVQGKPSQAVAGIRTDQTLTGGVTNESFILGRFATSGTLVSPYMSHGRAGKTPNAFLQYVIELAGTPGHQLDGIIVNGQQLEILTEEPHPSYGQRIGGRLTGRAWVRYYDGTQTEADPDLVDQYGQQEIRPWTADMVGAGVCYAIVTFQYDREVFQSWPTVRFILRGMPLYDPRKDSTVGGVGSHRWGQASTYEATDNPAVMVYNVKRGIRLPSGEIWGGGIPADDLDLTVWSAAMDKCDVRVSDGAGGTEPQYRAGIEVIVEDEPWTVNEELLKACAGAVAESGGVWSIRVGGPGLPVMAITDDDLLADAPDDFKPFPTIDAIYNAIEATYPDPASAWESRDADPIHNQGWEDEDGGRRLTASLPLPVVPYPVQVQRLMAALIADHRRMRAHVIVLPPEAAHLEALDVIAWTSDTNGYSAKLFEVRSSQRDLRDGRVTLTLREIDPGDYDPPVGLIRPSPPDMRPLLPSEQAVPGWSVVPARIRDADGIERRPGARLSWDPEAADDARGIRWAVRLSGETGTGIESALHGVSAGEAEIELLPATVYEIRARLVTDRRTIWSDWLSVLTPDLRLGPEDLQDDIAEDLARLHDWIGGGVTDLPGALENIDVLLAAEVQARIGAINDLANQITAEVNARAELAASSATRWREYRDQIRALVAEVIELAARDHTAREELRRSLTVQLGDMGAGFAEQILTLAGESLAAALRLTTLEASSADLSAAIQLTDIARIEGDNALAALIAQIAVGSAVQFDHTAIWYWDAAVEGWTGSPNAPAAIGGWLRPGVSSSVISPAGLAADGAAYAQIRARLRHVGAPVWQGWIWWKAAGQSWDAARRVAVPEPIWDGGIAMLTVNVPWAGVIDQVMLQLEDAATAETYIELDWLAIGRPAPGASSAELTAERLARIGGDEALAQDILDLRAELTDPDTGIIGSSTVISGLAARVTDTEEGIEAEGERIDALQSAITNPTTGLASLATAIDNIITQTSESGPAQAAQATALRNLRSVIRALQGEAIEGAARAHLGDQTVRDYVATAAQSLNTRIDVTEGQVTLISEAVTALQAAIPGLATGDALQALRVLVQGTAADLAVTASDLTSLQARIDHPSTGLASKLAAQVIVDYYTKTQANAAMASAATGATTALKSQLEGAGGSIRAAKDAADAAADLAATKAASSAVTSLTTRVSSTEGVVTALADALTQLGAVSAAGVAQTIMKMSAESSPSGVLARIGLRALVGDNSDNTRVAALFLEALAGGESRVVVQADRFLVTDGSARYALFEVSGGQIYLRADRIRLTGQTQVDGSFQVTGPMIANGAVSSTYWTQPATFVLNSTGASNVEDVVIPTNGTAFAPTVYDGITVKNPILTTVHLNLGRRAEVPAVRVLVEVEVALLGATSTWINLYGGNAEFNAIYFWTDRLEGLSAENMTGILIGGGNPNAPSHRIARMRIRMRTDEGRGVVYRPRVLIQQISR